MNPDKYEIRRFRPAVNDNGATRDWLEAAARGFYREPPTEERIARFARTADDDVTGTYAEGDPVPVATYSTRTRTLNTGLTLLPTHAVTSITVRPTHRRRGLLRRIITEDLERATQEGLAMATLVASEGPIYGRFGFGAAVEREALRIVTHGGLEMLPGPDGAHAKDDGVVELVDRPQLGEISEAVFKRFHERAPGSFDRHHAYPGIIDGALSGPNQTLDAKVHGVVHWDADGVPDGYATYRFEGWDEPRTMRVLDVAAANDAAYRAIWEYLGSLDLIDRVEWHYGGIDEPLRWMLADPRRITVSEREDHLWLRILDPIEALEARLAGSDGAVRIGVTDPLGLTDGTYDVVGEGGRLTATRSDAEPQVSLSIDALSSLYLGGVSALTLARAGRIAGERDAVVVLDRLLATDTAPLCITDF